MQIKFISENRNTENLFFLGKICFDTLNIPLEQKSISEDFCGIYFEGRNREINCIEDFAVVHSFKVFSQYNYPIFIFSPNSNNVLNNEPKYKNCNIQYVKIPECSSHDKYSQFMIKKIWEYLPLKYENLLFFHPDGFLIKSGWEEFVLNGKFDYIGSAWEHIPSIDVFDNNQWKCFIFSTKTQVGNGGFSFRKSFPCRGVSKSFENLILRESGREDNRPPPEDLFYSFFINGLGGRVASINQAMKFSLGPITLKEYNEKLSFGFHYPVLTNDNQDIRDYYLSII